MKHFALPLLFMALLCTACRHNDYSPKPQAYLRIDLPEATYRPLDTLSLHFEVNQLATVSIKKHTARDLWVDLSYPQWDGVIFLSYKNIHGIDDLRGQTDTSIRLMESHYMFASGVEEQPYEDTAAHVFGRVYYLRGNRVASTCQFWITDSTSHFLRGALYLNHTPNNDSLAPVVNYLQSDIEHLFETLRWQ